MRRWHLGLAPIRRPRVLARPANDPDAAPRGFWIWGVVRPFWRWRRTDLASATITAADNDPVAIRVTASTAG